MSKDEERASVYLLDVGSIGSCVFNRVKLVPLVLLELLVPVVLPYVSLCLDNISIRKNVTDKWFLSCNRGSSVYFFKICLYFYLDCDLRWAGQ